MKNPSFDINIFIRHKLFDNGSINIFFFAFLIDESVVVTVVLLAVLGVVFLFGTVANSLVFLVFYRRPSLRSLSNR